MGMTPEAASKPYDKLATKITYRWKRNAMQIPVAGPVGSGIGGQFDDYGMRTPSVLVDSAAPTGSVTLWFGAERVGAQPIVPHPEPGTGLAGMVLQEAVVT